MILRIVIAQLIVLTLLTLVTWALFDGVAAVSLFASGISMLIPSVFLATNMALIRFSKVFFWIGVFFNKFIILALFFVSIKIIGEPNYFAFLVGIVVVSQVPWLYVNFFPKKD
ncbi:ATP synthase subunit I [Ignatzschineria rhizosphaerae]|uniref:ATP synthase subunit I n=1 Tax=Ignatzschineria rhizosphaerae TaxID=2923279 RepID=A0ABY3X7X1_9GAMM|nr:ATP synthase subunit I [Ignatzschineria rhizosphaerae]UNM96108.1 ATP synthase subunit I [Ignatzschineria rhizosphaerae]